MMSLPGPARPELAEPCGPSAADLAAIDAEWPLIEAELAVVDAEIAAALSGPGGPSPLDWRRFRRAERRVLDARRLPAFPPSPAEVA
jgi:hypothetical protein